MRLLSAMSMFKRYSHLISMQPSLAHHQFNNYHRRAAMEMASHHCEGYSLYCKLKKGSTGLCLPPNQLHLSLILE